MEKLDVVIVAESGSFDRMLCAVKLATAFSLQGKRVALLVGHGALPRLGKGSSEVIGEETPAHLREKMKIALEKGVIPSIAQQLREFKKLGGKVYACPSAMAIHDLSLDDLDLEVVDGVKSIVELIGNEASNAQVIVV